MRLTQPSRAFLAAAALVGVAATSAARADTSIVLGTATPGGGFELFGGVVAEVVNAADPTLGLKAINTKGSRQNIPFLEEGKLDVGLVASLPAREAFEGIGRKPTDIKIIAAIYATFGTFAVRGDSPAQTFDDLVGKRVSWGTRSSGLTLLAKYVTEALSLDRDADFQATYLEKAGMGAPLVLDGKVDAQWGGGIGWPNFTKITEAGGRLVGLSEPQVARVVAAHDFLRPYVLEPGSYPNQTEPVRSVASYSFMLSRVDLPDDIAYRLAKALHQSQPALADRLTQGRETLPTNTVRAAPSPDRIHPGARRYLKEIGAL